jgi:hypothetical protein
MKVLILPQRFDLNEWFIVITLIVAYTVILRLPQRFPHTVTILIYLLSLTLEKTTDLVFEYPPYNLYYLNDVREYELFDFLVCFLYPASGYLMLYFYEKWNIYGISIFLYIMSWSIIAVGFEGLCALAGVFKYQGWKLMYSFPNYLIVISLYVMFFHFTKYLFMKTKKLKGVL